MTRASPLPRPRQRHRDLANGRGPGSGIVDGERIAEFPRSGHRERQVPPIAAGAAVCQLGGGRGRHHLQGNERPVALARMMVVPNTAECAKPVTGNNRTAASRMPSRMGIRWRSATTGLSGDVNATNPRGPVNEATVGWAPAMAARAASRPRHDADARLNDAAPALERSLSDSADVGRSQCERIQVLFRCRIEHHARGTGGADRAGRRGDVPATAMLDAEQVGHGCGHPISRTHRSDDRLRGAVTATAEREHDGKHNDPGWCNEAQSTSSRSRMLIRSASWATTPATPSSANAVDPGCGAARQHAMASAISSVARTSSVRDGSD